jgi:diguanylate cyclase (GGDEF)-like protein
VAIATSLLLLIYTKIISIEYNLGRYDIALLGRAIMKKAGSISLRQILVVSLISQVVVAVGLTSYFSWRNGQKTVEALALRLSREVTSHTQKQVNNYLNTPSIFLNINKVFAESRRLNVNNQQDLQDAFWLQTQITPQVDTLYYAARTGDFIEVNRKGGSKVAIRNNSTALNLTVYSLDRQGKIIEQIDSKEFDPRIRSWYQAAIKEKKLVWSPIYLFTNPPVLGITPAMPLIDRQTGTLEGVMAIDLTLDDISQFLNTLKISDSGRAFIIEQSGEIVATSTNNSLVVTTKTGNQRLHSADSEDDLIRATARFLETQFNHNFQNIEAQQQLIFKFDNHRNFVQITNLDSYPGLNWLMVTVIPESDFIEYIRSNTYTTMLLSFSALIAAACLGAIADRWINKSVTRFSEVVEAVSSGEIYTIDEQPTIKELALFTRSFNFMALQLKTSAKNLEDAESKWQKRVEERTKSLQEANQELNRLAHLDSLTQIYNRYHFDVALEQIWQQAMREQQEIAIILCDVDNFKLYNDTYGHLAGDRCLQQVAKAIDCAVSRGQDVAARYGGEEFVIILPNTKIAGAVRVAKRIKNAVNNLKIPHKTSTIKDYITLSCGVSCFLADCNLTPQDLITSADRALYQAKYQGRDRIVVG